MSEENDVSVSDVPIIELEDCASEAANVVEPTVGLAADQKDIGLRSVHGITDRNPTTTPETSNSLLLRARDSLENLLIAPTLTEMETVNLPTPSAAPTDITLASTHAQSTSPLASKSAHFGSASGTTTTGYASGIPPDARASESVLSSKGGGPSSVGAATSGTSSINKVLMWDPWGKLDRKKRLSETNRMDNTGGDELRVSSPSVAAAIETGMAAETETYTYQPYRPNSKSVLFTNEVQVVYISADKIVGQSREPLKKELDQQIRNKEMRKGHSDEYVQHLRQAKRLSFQ